MWSMTQDGFVSVVRKQAGGLEVRARDRGSIERFCDKARIARDRIVEGGGTDYQYRVRRVSKRDVKRYMNATVEAIDYSNFKNRVHDVHPKYAKALGRVWSVMWDIVSDADINKRSERIGRWSSGGAWSALYPPTKKTETVEGIGWPDATELLEMDDAEVQKTLWLLQEAKDAGDSDAGDVLADYDDLMGSISISDMTDDEFMKFEASDFNL